MKKAFHRAKYALLITLCLCIFIFSQFVFANEIERDIFIIDETGKTTYKYQYVTAVEDGYYLESFNLPVGIMPESKNLEFYDSDGAVSVRKTDEVDEEGFEYYNIRVQQTQYNKPRAVGFTHELEDFTTVRYQENYFFEYPYYQDSEWPRDVYVCFPEKASGYPKSYDSSPEDDWREDYETYDQNSIRIVPYEPSIYDSYEITVWNEEDLYPSNFDFRDIMYGTKSVEDQLDSVEPCPIDYQERKITNIKEDQITKLDFAFKDADEKTGLSTIERDGVSVSVPTTYRRLLEENIETIQPIIQTIEEDLKLKSPEKFVIIIASDNDRVFDGDNAMISYEDGNIFYQVGLLRVESNQFIQVNLLRGIINSAVLKTYGTETYDSWWTNGILTELSLQLMRSEGLPTQEVEEALQETAELIYEYSPEELSEMLETLDSEEVTVLHSAIVNQIEDVCPNHIINLNEQTSAIGIIFQNEVQLNNFLLYQLRANCGTAPREVLDRYYLEHDNVEGAIERQEAITALVGELPDEANALSELSQINTYIQDAKEHLAIGKVTQSNQFVEEANRIYFGSLQTKLALLEKLETIDDQTNSIPAFARYPANWLIESNKQKAVASIDQLDEDNFDVYSQRIIKHSSRAGIYSVTIILSLLTICLIFIWYVISNNSKKRA